MREVGEGGSFLHNAHHKQAKQDVKGSKHKFSLMGFVAFASSMS